MKRIVCGMFIRRTTRLRVLFETLVKEKLLTTRQDQYKNVVFAMPNRAVLGQLAAFIPAFVKANPKQPYLKEEALQILRALEALVQTSPYDTVTASLADLMAQGKRAGWQTQNWQVSINTFKTAGEEVRLVKTSGGPGLRTTKKDCGAVLRHHEVLAAFFKSGLV